MEAGLDSLAAIELRNNIQARFDLELPVTITFDHPTVNALASYIYDRLSGAHTQTVPSAPHEIRRDKVRIQSHNWELNVMQVKCVITLLHH